MNRINVINIIYSIREYGEAMVTLNCPIMQGTQNKQGILSCMWLDDKTKAHFIYLAKWTFTLLSESSLLISFYKHLKASIKKYLRILFQVL